MATTTAELVSYEDPVEITERVAIAGFLAGYTGNTRASYTTDLRICSPPGAPSHIRRCSACERAHLELFARWMEEEGRMRSTVARRLSTLASFYRYCHAEGILDRNPAANVRRPKVDYESRTLGLGPQRARRPARPGRARHAPRPCADHVAGDERAAHLRSARRRRRRPRRRPRSSDAADRAQGRQARHHPARPSHRPGARPVRR